MPDEELFAVDVDGSGWCARGGRECQLCWPTRPLCGPCIAKEAAKEPPMTTEDLQLNVRLLCASYEAKRVALSVRRRGRRLAARRPAKTTFFKTRVFIKGARRVAP